MTVVGMVILVIWLMAITIVFAFLLDAYRRDESRHFQELTAEDTVQNANIDVLDETIQNLTTRLTADELIIAQLTADVMQALLDSQAPQPILIQNGTITWTMQDGTLGPGFDPNQQTANGTYSVSNVLIAGLNHTLLTLNPFSPSPLTYATALAPSFYGGTVIELLMGAIVVDYTSPDDPLFNLPVTLAAAYGYNGQFAISRTNFLRLSLMNPTESEPDCIPNSLCQEGAFVNLAEEQSFFATSVTAHFLKFYYANLNTPSYSLVGSEFSLREPLQLIILGA
jgi:hypothetical protein